MWKTYRALGFLVCLLFLLVFVAIMSFLEVFFIPVVSLFVHCFSQIRRFVL
jgi:hypothetical protein